MPATPATTSKELVNVCERCLFWQGPEQPADNGVGECRRYPPRLFEVDDNPLLQTHHPATWPSHWCGEYEDKGPAMYKCICGGYAHKVRRRKKR